MTRTLVVGASGAFGFRVAERLCRDPAHELILAGRNLDRAKATAHRLQQTATGHPPQAAALDSERITPDALMALEPAIVINASGPFQEHSYRLAEAAIASRAHYIDLADATAFVTGIGRLDAAAKAAGVTVISGASSVPGLSSTVIFALADTFSTLSSIEIAISPGNRFDPGEATTRSVLSGVGRTHHHWRHGRWQQRFGWQDLKRVRFDGLGRRWLGNVDVPDLRLLPAAFPEIRTVSFQAGVELPLQHLSVWLLSWLVRARLLKNASILTPVLLPLKSVFNRFGSDAGGMRIEAHGTNTDGQPLQVVWTLVAGSGHGPYVPALPSVVLANKLTSGTLQQPGAFPCLNLFSLSEFEHAATGLDIRWTLQTNAPASGQQHLGQKGETAHLSKPD